MKDPTWISLSDLKRLYQRSKFKIRKLALLAAVSVFIATLFEQPKFTSISSFKLGKGKLEQSLPFNNLMNTAHLMIQDSNSSASLVLLSKDVLGKSIQKLGLQAEIPKRKFSFLKNSFYNLLSELKYPFKEEPHFQFKDTCYKGDKTLSLYLRILSSNSYEILDLNKERLCFGTLQKKLSFKDIELTLEKFPACFLQETLYPLNIHPLENVVATLKPLISIKPSKLDSQVLNLTFIHPEKSLSSLFLNTLMQSYQDVLKEENQRLADVQIAYLQKKHKELSETFDQELEEHASYLKKNLGEEGFVSLSQEIEMLSPPKETYLSKLFDVEFDLARFETPDVIFTNKESPSLPQLKAISHELNEATRTLELIKKDLPPQPKQDTLAFLLSSVQKTQALFEETKEEVHKKELSFAKGRLEHYLQDLIASLTIRQNTLQELASENFHSHFQGIDLTTAKNLFLSYNNELDSLQKDLSQLAYLREHLNSENFTLSSIGNVLSDSVTNDIIHKTSELELQLKDSITHSYKEHERLQDALTSQKKFLSSHLEQVQELKKIQLHLTTEKIKSLQQVITGLLKTEKRLLHNKLSDLNKQMSDLPTKWCFENKLKFKNELTKEIMQGLTHVSESKQLASHLYEADARPLDRATPPPLANYPFLLIFSFIAYLISSLLAYLYYYLKALLKGFPVSSETLQSLGEPFSGTLSLKANLPFEKIKQEDHETLRLLASFLEKKEHLVACLFIGSCSDYSSNLAQILSFRGKKTLIIDCSLETIPSYEEIPGLYHYLSSQIENPPIRTTSYFDHIPSSFTNSVKEPFTQERFSSLIHTLKTKYDLILLKNTSPLKSSHSLDLLSVTDSAIVSFERESLDELKKYSNWIRQKQNRYVTFVESEVKPFI